MRVRRLLFVQAPRPASLAPVFLAFLVIAVVAVLGFALTYWPRERGYSDYLPVRGEAASSTGAPTDGVLIPSQVPDLPGRTRRM